MQLVCENATLCIDNRWHHCVQVFQCTRYIPTSHTQQRQRSCINVSATQKTVTRSHCHVVVLPYFLGTINLKVSHEDMTFMRAGNKYDQAFNGHTMQLMFIKSIIRSRPILTSMTN